jgi:hypothetical protein
MVSNNTTKSLTCDVCQQRFSRNDHLKRHYVRRTSIGNLSYVSNLTFLHQTLDATRTNAHSVARGSRVPTSCVLTMLGVLKERVERSLLLQLAISRDRQGYHYS